MSGADPICAKPKRLSPAASAWAVVQAELRRRFAQPERVYACLVDCRLKAVTQSLNVCLDESESAAARAGVTGAERRWCGRVVADLAAADGSASAVVNVSAALERLAAAHEVWRAAPTEADELPAYPGVFYTPPALVSTVCRELQAAAAASGEFGAGSAAGRVLDPAVGCGAFLLGWLTVAAGADRPRRIECAARLHGWDLDPVAVWIVRWRLYAACMAIGAAGVTGAAGAAGTREGRRLAAALRDHIRVADGLMQPVGDGFDFVLGNPPFLFLSGKSSPVARLRRRDPASAQALAAAHAALTRRYAASSEGCRDYYKWFLQLALEQTRPGGWLGMVTPNTWLYLRHFRDVRALLMSGARMRTICDLGFGVFGRPTLGAAYFCAQRRGGGSGEAGAADGGVPAPKFYRAATAADRPVAVAAEWRGGDFWLYRTGWARALYRRRDLTTLGELATLAEGEHAVRRQGLVSSARRTTACPLAIFEDHKLLALQPPAVRWWPAAAGPRVDAGLRARHAGARLLLRKTGAGLLVAPAAVTDAGRWVLAHQNVYMVRARVAEVPVHWLALWLTAAPVQRLYREGPHGQPGRPLAQLRIAHLKLLPAPPPAQWQAQATRLEALWQTRPAMVTAASAAGWRARLAAVVTAMYRPAAGA